MTMQKGEMLWVDGCWYIVVEKSGEHYHCICDHANNIYSWKFEDAQHYATKEDINDSTYGQYREGMSEVFHHRSVPWEELYLTLAGKYDHRFKHWL